jgi:hypothetical protein
MLLPNRGSLKRVQCLAYNYRLKHKRVLTSSPICKDEMLRTPAVLNCLAYDSGAVTAESLGQAPRQN